MSAWYIEEVDTGLIDGFYFLFEVANDMRSYYQERFPKLKFIVREQTKKRAIHDCELISEADWFINAKESA